MNVLLNCYCGVVVFFFNLLLKFLPSDSFISGVKVCSLAVLVMHAVGLKSLGACANDPYKLCSLEESILTKQHILQNVEIF